MTTLPITLTPDHPAIQALFNDALSDSPTNFRYVAEAELQDGIAALLRDFTTLDSHYVVKTNKIGLLTPGLLVLNDGNNDDRVLAFQFLGYRREDTAEPSLSLIVPENGGVFRFNKANRLSKLFLNPLFLECNLQLLEAMGVNTGHDSAPFQPALTARWLLKPSENTPSLAELLWMENIQVASGEWSPENSRLLEAVHAMCEQDNVLAW